MKYKIIDQRPDQPSARTADLRAIEAAGGAWTRFGDKVLVRASNVGWARVEEGLPKTAHGAEREGEAARGGLRLVVQKGRTFQLEHPQVPVILDKGRFLVVELPAAEGRRLSGRREPCFRVLPLPENAVVFEQRARVVPRETVPLAVTEAAEAISQPAFEAVIARLVSIRSRISTGAGFVEAVEWMRGEFAALGLDMRTEPVDVNGAPSQNLYAFRSGVGAHPRHFLVTAHLDSINQFGGPEAPAPGADDNASGSAGALTLARALAGVTLKHDVTFILFGGEEQGLLGSKQYVAGLSEAERRRIGAVVNMDMIGALNSRPASVLLEGAPLSQAVIDGLAAAAGRFTGLSVQVSLDPHDSDHVPFIEAGIPAVLTIEGADGANDAVHTDRDTLDRVDPAFAVEILRMNAGFLAAAAEAVVERGSPTEVAPAAQPSLSSPTPPCGCGASAAEAGTAAATRALAGHYHALFAQYARLRRQGAIESADLADWQAAWDVYDMLVAGPEGPRLSYGAGARKGARRG